jgi:NADH-quinone oxidoreductase subunit L
MRWPLWVLAVPALALGVTASRLPDYFDGHSLNPTLVTSVLGTGLALVGLLVTYGAWRSATHAHLAPRVATTPAPGPSTARPAPTAPAAPEPDAATTEALTVGARPGVFPHNVEVPDPLDPGRLLLGPLHGPAAHGFHLDAVYAALVVRPTLAAARLVRFLDREVVETYVHGAALLPRALGTAVRRTQTGNVQTYLSALLAGAVVLAVLVAVGV